ncbi:MAG: Peptidase amidohydrolase, partial [Pseudomonadota bacterium]
EMEGTVRTYDPAQRRDTHQRIRRMVEQTAAASGAKGEAKILEKYGVTVNDPKLTARAGPALQWAAQGDVGDAPQVGGAEDFSFMADKVPAFFFFLGATAPKADMKTALPNHNPGFSVDESTLLVGVRAMSALAADFLDSTLPAGK